MEDRDQDARDRFVDQVEESSVQTGAESAEAVRTLARGPELNLPIIGPIPRRTVVAVAAFIVVTTVVYLILWAVLGTLGLAFGWIVAALAGAFAVKRLGDHYS